MSDKIKNIINKIGIEIKKLKNNDDYTELEKVLHGHPVDKLNEFDKTISEELKILRIRVNDPLSHDDLELINSLRFSELQSIQAEENKQIRSKINDLIKKLRIKSKEENFVFFDSPFEIYEKNYSILRDNYLEGEIDLDEADFLKNELKKRLNKDENRFLLNDKKEKVKYDFYLKTNDSIKKSEYKKIRFLKEKLKNLGWITKLNEKEYTFEESKHLEDDGTSYPDIEKPKEQNQEEYPRDIFVSHEGYMTFKKCVDFLGFVEKKGEVKRGFYPSCNAIFENLDFKKSIFKQAVKRTSYRHFLSKEYGVPESNRLPISDNHADDVAIFIKKEAQNKPT